LSIFKDMWSAPKEGADYPTTAPINVEVEDYGFQVNSEAYEVMDMEQRREDSLYPPSNLIDSAYCSSV